MLNWLCDKLLAFVEWFVPEVPSLTKDEKAQKYPSCYHWMPDYEYFGLFNPTLELMARVDAIILCDWRLVSFYKKRRRLLKASKLV